MNILITGNPTKSKFAHILNEIILLSEKYKKHNFFLDNFINGSEKYNIAFKKIYNSSRDIDLVICIGGDGALLSAVRRMGDCQIPVLGIHIGNLGFLNKLTLRDYYNELEGILKNECIEYDPIHLLSANFINHAKEKMKIYALNEIFINRADVSRLLTVEIIIDSELLNLYRCDGLIISTPLGSTAYSLSAGGPIVESSVNSHIITPVSPHSLSSRPIVVDNKCVITAKRDSKYDNVTVFSDGQKSEKVFKNSDIIIKKSSIYAKFLKFKGEKTYYEKLRSNLGWYK